MRSFKPNPRIVPILNPDWLTPSWPAPAHVKAVFTTRQGGVSVAPFDRLNLGNHVGDKAEHVARNRKSLAQAIAAQPVYLKQVHGTDVVSLDANTPDGTMADACFTTHSNVACTIMVADCLPVLFTNLDGTFVAAAHAGWRGLAAGVLQHIFDQIYVENHVVCGANKSCDAINTIAWLGPCIGASAFEVGDEVKAAFTAQSSVAAGHFVPKRDTKDSKWLANLAGLARIQLQQMGILSSHIFGNDGSAAWCTVTQKQRFFSHRRDAATLGSSGRMAACVWLDGHTQKR